MTKFNRKKLYSVKELTERGWTKSIIYKFLDKPDFLKPNPYYKSSPPMKFYKIFKVFRAEEKETFKEKKLTASKRSIINKKVIDKKVNTALENLIPLCERFILKAKSFKIKIKYKRKDVLIEEAILNYNNHNFFNDKEPIGLPLNEKFMNRLIVNHIRHCYTSYEKIIDSFILSFKEEENYNRVKSIVNDYSQKAYIIVNNRIFNKISEVYPSLSLEIERQRQSKKNEIKFLNYLEGLTIWN